MARENKIISIKKAENEKPLSKLQKQFNNYILKIEKLKADIEKAKSVMAHIQKETARILVPLEKQLVENTIQWLISMDWSYENLKFGKRDKETISEIISEHTEDILLNTGSEDAKEVLTHLHDKHSDITLQEKKEEESEDAMDRLKFFMAGNGVDMGDEKMDPNDPESFIHRMEELMHEQLKKGSEQNIHQEKSKKQIEREEKQRIEEKNISKSVRDIYTGLVKAFHPDLEQDEKERDRKTEIMKLITVAKEQNDLVALLRLQLEYEQIDQSKINQFADEQVKHFNKILKEQTDALQEEFSSVTGAGYFGHPYKRFGSLELEVVDFKISKAKKELKEVIEMYGKDVVNVKDIRFMKQVLKHHREIEKSEADAFFRDLDVGDLNDFFKKGF